MREVTCSVGRAALRRLRTGLLASVCATLALLGCGGSGNDVSPPPTPPAVAAPTITAAPLAQSVVSGQGAVFDVAASGTDLQFQWRRDGIDIIGAVAARYTLAAPQASDHGATFSVAVRNAGGSVNSAAARLSVLAITTAPQPLEVSAGSAANFAVAFTGDGVSLQWQRDGSDLAGATQATLTLPSTTLADDQSAYAVTLRNAAGSLKSAPVRLGIKPLPPGSLELVAGDAGGAGNLDGAAAAARFSFITHLAFETTTGRLWVVDGEYRVLRRIGSDGQVLTVAGVAGSQQAVDGPAAQARFAGITKIAWSAGPPTAALYLIDGGRLRRVDADGRVTTLGSAVAGYVDGPLADARFRQLGVVAAHPDGSLLVTEVQDCAVRRIDLAAGVVSTLARSNPCTNLGTTLPPLADILALAVDGKGRVHALKGGAVLRIDAAGGVTLVAAFEPPSAYGSTGRDLAVDTAGRVNFLVTNDGQSTGTFFNLLDDGSVGPSFTYATSIGWLSPFVITPSGRFVYGDTELISLRAAGAGLASEVLAGAPVIVAKAAAKPLAVQADGALLRFDKASGSFGALVRSLPSGVEEVVPLLQDYAGAPSEMVSDGQGGAYTLWTMPGFCITGYCQPEPGRIDHITATGQVVFIAGSGAAGESDGSGNMATFLYPRGLALGSAGDVFVTTADRIRRITTAGVVSTLAAGLPGHGVLASDRQGNLYHAAHQGTVISRITPQGQVSVFHDPAITSTDEALRLGIWGLAVAANGDLLVARCRAAVVDRITPAGVVSTVVGTPGLVGIRTGSLPGALSCPSALSLDERGNLYIKTDNALLKARFNP